MRTSLLFALSACTASLDPYVDVQLATTTDTGVSVDTASEGTERTDGDDDDDDDEPIDTGALVLPSCADDRVVVGTAYTGHTAKLGDDAEGSCGGDRGNDALLAFTAPTEGRWTFTLSGTFFDTTLYVNDGCRGPELVCADTEEAESVAVDLDAGQEVILVVDAAGQGEGVFTIDVTPSPDAEGACNNNDDDDNDGLIDCEDPDCEGKPACVEDCSDGVDNNLDGLVDCLDPSCDADASCEAPCADDVLSGTLPIVYQGSTSGGGRDTDPGCQGNSDARDRAFSFVVPADGNYTMDTSGSTFDTVLYVLDGCGGAEAVCDDDSGSGTTSRVTGALSEGQRVIIVVDGYQQEHGNFRLSVF